LRGLEHAHQQMSGAHLVLAEHQRTVQPSAFDGGVDEGGDVADRRSPAGQTVQRLRQFARDGGRVQFIVADDAVQVAVRRIEDLHQPVLQLHQWIAAHLAEHRRALDGLVGQRVELAERCGTGDVSH